MNKPVRKLTPLDLDSLNDSQDYELPPEDPNTLINPDDFKSIKLKVDLANTTTTTEIRDGKRMYGIGVARQKKDDAGDDFSIQITEFIENGLVLEVPSRVCSAGHILRLNIKTEGAKPELQCECVAKVEAVEKLLTLREVVRLHFTQIDEDAWEKIQNIYSQRQLEVLRFFKAAKG